MLKNSLTNWRKKANPGSQGIGLRVLFVLFCVLTSSCAYQFTNKHIKRPAGVHTIAVEAIYDTSREVLPHELLWESLQAAFAADGHLKLVAQSDADAMVRAHIKTGAIEGSGAVIANDKPLNQPDPKAFTHDTPPAPTDFRRLTRSGQSRDSGNVSAIVAVEVWNLNTHEVLLRQEYPMKGDFRADHSGIKDAGSSPGNNFLRYDEASRARFKALADGIAAGVVQDLLVQ